VNFKELAAEVFIAESIGNNLILFDIDDTLLKAQGIKLYRKLPTDKKEVELTPGEYAKEKVTPELKQYYDYRDFRDPVKVAESIKTSLPIISNLKILDSYIKNADSMKKWLKHKNEKGDLQSIGDKLVRELVFGMNDSNKKYEGASDFDKKANVIKKLAKKYDRVVFYDDDLKNIAAVKEMVEKENIKNVVARVAKK